MKSPEQTGGLPEQPKERQTPEKSPSYGEITRQKRKDFGLKKARELTTEESVEIEKSIEELLERLDKYDYNGLDPKTQDEWYCVEQEATVGKDRELAKAALERFLDVLQDLFPMTPFREPLKETEYRSEIKELKSRPDKLVRESFGITFRGSRTKINRENLNRYIEKFLKGKKLFARLRETYGIKIVSMDYVIGQNDKGDLKLFTIVDRIDGENLKDVKILPAEAKKEIDSTYAAMAQHYLDAYKNKSDFWRDPSNRQFVYGRKYGEKENHVYLVDVDPEINVYGEQEEREFNEDLFFCLEKVCEDALMVEKKFKSPIKLSQSREKLMEVVDALLKEESKSRIKSGAIDKLKDLLNYY